MLVKFNTCNSLVFFYVEFKDKSIDLLFKLFNLTLLVIIYKRHFVNSLIEKKNNKEKSKKIKNNKEKKVGKEVKVSKYRV